MQYALEGIRVLDLGEQWAVPTAGMYLGDQGADVIKMERLRGDNGRFGMTAAPAHLKDGSIIARHFLPINRNKRSIAMDIRKDEGREILYQLIKRADVMLLNFRPQACRKLGIDYDTVHRMNPRLIYLWFSPFGQKGPYADMPGYDRAVQAIAGAHGRRQLLDGTPLAAGVWLADSATPMLISYAVALALFVREKTGEGQKIDLSLLSGALAMQTVDLVRTEHEKSSGVHSYADTAAWAPYQCADGKWIIAIIFSDSEWPRYCKALGVEHLGNDPKYATVLKRAEESDTLYQVCTGIYSTKPRDEWLKILRAADIVCAPVLSPNDVFDHPQAIENDLIVEVDDPRIGKVKMVGIAAKLSQTPGDIRRLAPDLGQHTDEILSELGYLGEEINTLRQKGIIK